MYERRWQAPVPALTQSPCACPMCCPGLPEQKWQPRGMGNHGIQHNGQPRQWATPWAQWATTGGCPYTMKNMNKNRQSIRLRKYDYSQSGAYFVTICAQNKKCFFGDITNEKMVLSDSGRMINIIWNELPFNYPGVNIDEFQIIPNHIHGIIVLVGAGPCACPEMTDHIDMGQPRGQNGQPRGGLPLRRYHCLMLCIGLNR